MGWCSGAVVPRRRERRTLVEVGVAICGVRGAM